MSEMGEFAHGSSIRRSVDQGANWVRIPLAKKASVPTVEPEYYKRTNLDTVGNFHEYGVGFFDAGEVEVPAYYTQAEYEALLVTQGAKDELFIETTFTGGRQFFFRAFVAVSIDDVEVEEERTMTIKLKVSGSPRATLAALQADVA